jgi:putative endonuclease
MSRRDRERAGRRAETLAALVLRLKGFSILARRFACHAGEVDLIARRGDLVVFVEVKRRASVAGALEAVSRRQQERIARAASHFLQRQPRLAGLAQRFDVIAVVPWRWPLHLRDVWRP